MTGRSQKQKKHRVRGGKERDCKSIDRRRQTSCDKTKTSSKERGGKFLQKEGELTNRRGTLFRGWRGGPTPSHSHPESTTKPLPKIKKKRKGHDPIAEVRRLGELIKDHGKHGKESRRGTETKTSTQVHLVLKGGKSTVCDENQGPAGNPVRQVVEGRGHKYTGLRRENEPPGGRNFGLHSLAPHRQGKYPTTFLGAERDTQERGEGRKTQDVPRKKHRKKGVTKKQGPKGPILINSMKLKTSSAQNYES